MVHASSFLILKNEEGGDCPELCLPGEFSEWLFAVGFWADVNDKLGTMFGQYEDDPLPHAQIADVVHSLDSARNKFLYDVEKRHRVKYAWISRGESREFIVQNETLTEFLDRLRAFLVLARSMNCDVYCQL